MKYRLGELIESISKTYDLKNKESVTFVNTGDVFDGSISGNETKIKDLPGQAKKSIELNDILFSEIRPKNKRFALVTGIDPKNYVVSTKLMVLRNKNNLVLDTNYLYFYLTSPLMLAYFQSEAESRSGTFPQITFRENVANIKIDLPPLIEQRKIVQRLSVINDKVKLNNQINDNLVELVDSYFINFLNNVTTVEKTIEDIGTVVGGGTPSKKIAAYWNGDIAWVTPKDLSQHPLIFTSSGENYITGLGLAKGSAKLLPTNTILFSSRAPIGYISIAKNNLATNQGFKSVIPNKEYSFQFIYELLKHETTAIKNEANGSTFKEISGKKLKQHIINIPNSEDTSKFNEITKPIFKQLRKLEEENEKLLAIKKELLEKYF